MRIGLAILFACVPMVAHALSCMAPNAGRELNAMLENDTPVAVVAGKLLPPAHVPRRKGHATVTIRYRVEGTRLAPDGRNLPFEADIDLESNCVAVWCPELPAEPLDGLFILRDRGRTGFALTTGPCPHGLYVAHDDARIDALERCLAKGACEAAELEILDYRRQ